MRTLPTWLCSTALAWILLLGWLAPTARAQCLPDGLDGGSCCLPANATLPAFPGMNAQSVRFVCFNSCSPSANALWCAQFGVPQPMQAGGAFVCGAYNIGVRIKACGFNNNYWKGNLSAYYSRNWQATSIPGTVNLTVWRFLLNGDLTPAPSLPANPNFRPACLSAFPSVYFTGYIDYAFDCISNTWQVAWNLNHECDGIHHALGTARPAPASGFHASRSFSFIGPGTTFVVSSTNPQVSNGNITQQAMRWNSWATVPQICTFEEPASGIFVAMNNLCSCTAGGANQYNEAFVQATGACGSAITPSSAGLLRQKRLGAWTNPNVYPGNQRLLFDFGFLDQTSACVGTVTTEWFEGTETLGGYPAVDFNGLAIDTQFEDLGSANASATAPAPLIGAPHVVYYLLNFNMP